MLPSKDQLPNETGRKPALREAGSSLFTVPPMISPAIQSHSPWVTPLTSSGNVSLFVNHTIWLSYRPYLPRAFSLPILAIVLRGG